MSSAPAEGVTIPAAPSFLVLNQTLGPLAWELAEDLAERVGPVSLYAGERDAPWGRSITLHQAVRYNRSGYVARLWSWLRYAASAAIWLLRAPGRTPVLFFSNPPFLPWLGPLVCRLKRQPYSVVVLDIYPDVLVRLGKLGERNPLTRCWRALNRRAYQGAEVVLTLGDRMAQTLASQFDPVMTGYGKIGQVYPWADTTEFRPIAKGENPFARRHAQVDRLTVMYSGNMGIGHDLETLVATAERLRDLPSIHFMCIGGGARREMIAETIRRDRLQNVTLLDWQPREVLPQSLATGDLAVVTLDEEMGGLAVPSKAFSSLAVGSAIIAICAENSELADIVQRYDCGWVVPPGHPEMLESLLRRIEAGELDLAAARARSRSAAEMIGSRANSAAMVDMLCSATRTPGAVPSWTGVKRLFDLFAAFVGIIATAPLMVVVWGILRLALGPSVIFRQLRPGLQGRPFLLYKFRTMRQDRDAGGELLPDAARLGRIGRVIRRTSLDELPSLVNVLRGEMSLVGPRPLLMEYLPLYSPRQARRHEVLPGLTGWAQINGRNSLGWEERLEMDVWYVENRSFRLDLEILLRTLGKVLRSEGISHPRHATMEKFRGSH